MNPIALDIETVPLASSLAAPYPAEDRPPPGNYKNEDAIARWREKDEAEWRAGLVKQCSLNPRLGRIVAIGAASPEWETEANLACEEGDEVELLAHAWDIIRDSMPLVTWNGDFDIRWIAVRSIIRGVRPRVSAATYADLTNRYRTRHVDVKRVLVGYDTRVAGEGLDEWSTVLGVINKPMLASEVYEQYAAGRFDEIRAYVTHDVNATLAIYDRVKPYIHHSL